jgi:hypothetical protein
MLKTLLAALALFGLLQPALADDQDFLLFNRTGLDIKGLQVMPADAEAEQWSEDLLKDQTLATGQDRLIMFDTEITAPKWIVRAVDGAGNKLEWREVDLITATGLVLEADGVARIKQ